MEIITGKHILELSQNTKYPALNKNFPKQPMILVKDADLRVILDKMLQKQQKKRASIKWVIK